tara:strand:+ start:133 stop:378 length:246 start_codon:yes stop_codon:yes gene_type:complete
MTQPTLQITPADIQAVMQSDQNVSLKVQLAAAMRRITELELELARNGHGSLKAEEEEVDAKGRKEEVSVHGKGQNGGTPSS